MVSLAAMFARLMKTFCKLSTLRKCVNGFYLTFGNFDVISLTKFTKINIFENRLPKK